MHTKLVSLFIALFLCLPLFAQKESVPRIDSEGVYLIPDEMPKFPGGMQAMMKYLATNVKYPVEAQKKGVSGRVIIQFVVMEDGTPGQGKVVRGVDPLLDEEALRVVKTMPKWSPGMADGKAVKVRFTIPVMFSLSKKQNGNTPNMNIPELTVPSGQEVTNKSLEGVWQSCLVQPGAHDFRIALLPVLKVIECSDREQFILDNQEAFNYGAMEEFGLRDDHFEEEDQIILIKFWEKNIPLLYIYINFSNVHYIH